MADFEFKADFPVKENKEYDVIVSQFENSVEQRRLNRSSVRRSFRLEFSYRNQSEMEEVRDFYDDKSGMFESFTFLNPNDSTTYTVRFNMPKFEYSRIGPGLYNFSVDLIEVL